MNFTPARFRGTLFGTLFLVMLLAAMTVSLVRLSTASLSAWIFLWTLLPLLGFPLTLLVLYRLFGLITARYRLDRNGFYLTWGLCSEQVPLSDVLEVCRVPEAGTPVAYASRRWWPGHVFGVQASPELGEVAFYSTLDPQQSMLVRLQDRALVVSPVDAGAFQDAFIQATRMGSLEAISARSQRPDFALTGLWTNIGARALVLVGFLLPLLLMGYLALSLPSLPATVPFGYSAAGEPSFLAPPGRLLLLPMIGGLCWLFDFALGAWLFRRKANRPIAYVLWVAAIVVGGLLWGAALQLLGNV